MQPIPETVKWYGALLITGAATLVVALVAQGKLANLMPDDILMSLVFILFIMLAGQFPLHVSTKTNAVVDTSLVFAALLLFPMPLASVVAGLGVLASELLFRHSLLDAAINTGVVMLEVLTAQWAYLLLGGAIPPRFDDPATAIPLLIAGLVMLAADYWLEAVAVSLHVGTSIGRVFSNSWRGELKEDAALLLLGVLTALVVQIHAWALLLTAVPIALVYLSLRNSLRLKVLTRDAVESLVDLIDRRDPYTAGHSVRVARLAERLAEEMGLPWDEVETIRAAARVHDLGKIEIDGVILTKPARLAKHEWQLMYHHPVAGAEILARFPEFTAGADYVRYHHERWDGEGYPTGLRGQSIPLGARIIAVADAFDAMTSDRPYRKALPLEDVVEAFKDGAGRQWSEEVVAALLRILEQNHVQVGAVVVPVDVQAWTV